MVLRNFIFFIFGVKLFFFVQNYCRHCFFLEQKLLFQLLSTIEKKNSEKIQLFSLNGFFTCRPRLRKMSKVVNSPSFFIYDRLITSVTTFVQQEIYGVNTFREKKRNISTINTRKLGLSHINEDILNGFLNNAGSHIS